MIYLEVTQKAGFFSRLWPFGSKKPMTAEETADLQAQQVAEAAKAADLQANKETATRRRNNYEIANRDALKEIFAKHRELSMGKLEKTHEDKEFKFPEGSIEGLLANDSELANKEKLHRSQLWNVMQKTSTEQLASSEKDTPDLDLSDEATKRTFMNAIWGKHRSSLNSYSPVVRRLGEEHGLLEPLQTAEEIQQNAQRQRDEHDKRNRDAEDEEFGLGGGRGIARMTEAPERPPEPEPSSSSVPTGYRTVVAYHGVPMKDPSTRGPIQRQFLRLSGVRKVATVSPTDWSGVEFHIEHDDDFEAGLKDPSDTGNHLEGHPLALYPKGKDHPPSVYKQQPIYDDTEASASDPVRPASPERAPE